MKPEKVKHHDRILVEVDGEERVVYNWVTTRTSRIVRPFQTHDGNISIHAGDKIGEQPSAVTGWLAARLWEEHTIDVEDHGIDVIHIEDDDVTIL